VELPILVGVAGAVTNLRAEVVPPAPVPKREARASEPQFASAAAVQIVREAAREGVSVVDLSRLAVADPAFAVRVLGLVNSPALGRGRSITDVNQAANLLGVRGLQTVGLSLVLSDLVPLGPDGELLLAQSLRRGMAGRLLATEMRAPDPDSHFTTGLLLDVGLLLHVGQSRSAAIEVARLPAAHRVMYEEMLGLVAHPEAGAELCRKLLLSEETVDAIARHHDASPPEGISARIAWLAERVASVFESGAIGPAREVLLNQANQIGVKPEHLDRVLNQYPAS
jgi:HD-like signal output (HDOD) protein